VIFSTMAAFLLEDSSIDDVRRESQTKGGGKGPALLTAESSQSCFCIHRLTKRARSSSVVIFYEGGI
jgi:hypothetical protein